MQEKQNGRSIVKNKNIMGFKGLKAHNSFVIMMMIYFYKLIFKYVLEFLDPIFIDI